MHAETGSKSTEVLHGREFAGNLRARKRACCFRATRKRACRRATRVNSAVGLGLPNRALKILDGLDRSWPALAVLRDAERPLYRPDLVRVILAAASDRPTQRYSTTPTLRSADAERTFGLLYLRANCRFPFVISIFRRGLSLVIV